MSWTPELFDAAHAARPFADFEPVLYTAVARAVGGPVVELGCGTARVLAALLAAGVDADGIERDAAMADAAREKLVAAGFAGERVVTADMLDVRWCRRYRLAILPSNTVGSLETHDELSRLFDHIKRGLQPGGEVALDATQLSFDAADAAFEARVVVSRGDKMLDAVYRQSSRHDASSNGEYITERFEFDDGTVVEAHHRQRSWSQAELEAAFGSRGFRYAVALVDESGKPPSVTSRLLFMRLVQED